MDRRVMEWREASGVRWIEARLPGATVAFSSRSGGVSEGPYESLNLGLLTDDERDAVRENRHRLAAALGLDAVSVVVGHQVHGAELAHHTGPQAMTPFATPAAMPEADGHVVSSAGLAALVLVADCLPVALRGTRGVAMLHCGWRGLAAGIVERGAAAVDATHAAIGPGIAPCCYEVGGEVLDAFAGLGGGVVQGNAIDLVAVAERHLREAGVEAIESARLCTSCEAGSFFSHRRDAGRSGRQAGVVWLDDEGET